MKMTEPKYFAELVLRGKLSRNVPMSRHTSWRAGGVAERMYQPADLDDLLVFLRGLPADEPLYAFGLGSNLLVRDGGLRGTVLLLHGALNALRIEADGSISPQEEAVVVKPLKWQPRSMRSRRAGRKAGALLPPAQFARRGILRRNSRHGRRHAGDECRLLWQETREKMLRVLVVDRSGALLTDPGRL